MAADAVAHDHIALVAFGADVQRCRTAVGVDHLAAGAVEDNEVSLVAGCARIDGGVGVRVGSRFGLQRR